MKPCKQKESAIQVGIFHRRVGMGGDIFLKSLLREIGAGVSKSKVKISKKKIFMKRISKFKYCRALANC